LGGKADSQRKSYSRGQWREGTGKGLRINITTARGGYHSKGGEGGGGGFEKGTEALQNLNLDTNDAVRLLLTPSNTFVCWVEEDPREGKNGIREMRFERKHMGLGRATYPTGLEERMTTMREGVILRRSDIHPVRQGVGHYSFDHLMRTASVVNSEERMVETSRKKAEETQVHGHI